jgi:hypothetical protein
MEITAEQRFIESYTRPLMAASAGLAGLAMLAGLVIVVVFTAFWYKADDQRLGRFHPSD